MRAKRTAVVVLTGIALGLAGCQARQSSGSSPGSMAPAAGLSGGGGESPLGGMGGSVAMAAATHNPYVIAYRAAARRLKQRFGQVSDAGDGGSATGNGATASAAPALPTLCFPQAGCLPPAAQTARAGALNQHFLAAAVGTRASWQSAEGDSGSVTLTSDFTAPDGAACKTFAEDLLVGGRSEAADGAACLEPDNVWQIIDAEPRPPATMPSHSRSAISAVVDHSLVVGEFAYDA
jgi:hypothetical protein